MKRPVFETKLVEKIKTNVLYSILGPPSPKIVPFMRYCGKIC